jgi:HD-like signal output (HDOD) protein
MDTQMDPQQSATNSSLKNDEEMSVKDRIIDKICNDPDLPTLGNSLAKIVQLSSSEDGSTDQLANLILSDVALTQKIIRLANSVAFRGTSNQTVTNISRAIQLLGLDTIKACALGMILIDGMPEKHTQYVKKELMSALAASLIGRQLAKHSHFPNAEEVAIAALFRNMGRLLLAAYDHKLYKATMDLIKQQTRSQTQASLRIIGCSFDTLTEIAMQEWLIPEFIINAMRLLSAKVLTPAKNRQEWMRQVTEFSETAAQLICSPEESAANSVNEILLKRFGNALNLDQMKLDELIAQTTEEVHVFSNQANLQLPAAKEAGTQESSATNTVNSTGNPSDLTSCHPSGKPYNALDQLLSGMLEVTTLTATSGYKINELVLLVLEILYKSLGFSSAAICLKDIKTNQYRARHFFGENNVEIQRGFIFSDTASDLFSLSIKKNTDLSISDTRDTKIQSMLPDWYLRLLPNARSFVILPLVINDKPIGIYYFERQHAAPEGISLDEMKVIKSLKKQVLAALSWQQPL